MSTSQQSIVRVRRDHPQVLLMLHVRVKIGPFTVTFIITFTDVGWGEKVIIVLMVSQLCY